jgi:hypothetical protein
MIRANGITRRLGKLTYTGGGVLGVWLTPSSVVCGRDGFYFDEEPVM